MLTKGRFLAVNSSISGRAGSKLQSETCTVATSLVCKNSCSLSNIANHCEQEYKTCYYLKMPKYEEKVHVFFKKNWTYNTVKTLWVTLTTFLGCLSCINVTKEYYQIGKANLVTLVSLATSLAFLPHTMQPRNSGHACRCARSKQQHKLTRNADF